MRCYICDGSLSEPEFNKELAVARDEEGKGLLGSGGFEPCVTCRDVIQDTIGRDKASASEDELGEDSDLTDLADYILSEGEDV